MIVQDCLASYVCGISLAFLRVNTNQLGMQEIMLFIQWVRYGIIDNYTDISSILCSSQYKECTSFLNVEWFFEDIMSVCILYNGATHQRSVIFNKIVIT